MSGFGGGGFGTSSNNTPPAPPAPFGAVAPNPSAGFSGGGFGNASTNPQQLQPFGSAPLAPFGTTPQQPFGSQQPLASTGTSGLGGSNTIASTPSTFGQPSSGGGGGGMTFGASSNVVPFGASTTTTTTTSGFGSSSGPFGGSAGSGFGSSSNTTTPFGGGAGSSLTGFGSTPVAPTTFSSSFANQPFGAVPSATQTSTLGPFGGAGTNTATTGTPFAANTTATTPINPFAASGTTAAPAVSFGTSANTIAMNNTSDSEMFTSSPQPYFSSPMHQQSDNEEDMWDEQQQPQFQQQQAMSNMPASITAPVLTTSTWPAAPTTTTAATSTTGFGRSSLSPIPETIMAGAGLSPNRADDAVALTSAPSDETIQKANEDTKLAKLKARIEEKKRRLEETKRQKEAAAAREAAESKKKTLNAAAPVFVPSSSSAAATPSSTSASFSSEPQSLAEKNKERFATTANDTIRAHLPADLRALVERGEATNYASLRVDEREEAQALEHAVSLVGTCQYMCPDEELLRREREGDIQLLEIPQPGTLHPADWTLRDTVVKRFRRSAADYKLDVPEWVRPPDVLERVCGYLEEWVMERDRQGPDPRFPQGGTPPALDVYQFIWDRTRMIRKDFILQNYVGTGGNCDARAVRCHERIARWHAMCEHQLSHISQFVIAQSQQNIQELGQTMKTLNQFYDDSLKRSTIEVPDEQGNETRPNVSGSFGCTSDVVHGNAPVDYDGSPLVNDTATDSLSRRLIGKDVAATPSHGTAEPEMRGLYILLTMNNDGGMEVLKYAGFLFRERPDVYHTRPVQLALSIYKAKKEINYARFFSLLRSSSTPYLYACIMFKHVEMMRKAAFKIMSKTYGGRSKDSSEAIYDSYPLRNLVKLLCFEDADEARAACQHYNITVKATKVRSSSGNTRMEDIIFWKQTSFKDRVDPEKGVVVPLRPRKMIRTIESKLGGSTRLAVCRGGASGEHAVVVPSRRVTTVPQQVSERNAAAMRSLQQEQERRRQKDDERQRRLEDEERRLETLRREEAEQRQRQEQEQRLIQEKLHRQQQEAEVKRQRQEELRRMAEQEAEERAREEAVEKARKEAEVQARREQEQRLIQEKLHRQQLEEEAKRQQQEELRRIAQQEAEQRAREEAAERARKEAELRALREAEAAEKARKAAEELARRQAEERARREAEERAKKEEIDQIKKELVLRRWLARYPTHLRAKAQSAKSINRIGSYVEDPQIVSLPLPCRGPRWDVRPVTGKRSLTESPETELDASDIVPRERKRRRFTSYPKPLQQRLSQDRKESMRFTKRLAAFLSPAALLRSTPPLIRRRGDD